MRRTVSAALHAFASAAPAAAQDAGYAPRSQLIPVPACTGVASGPLPRKASCDVAVHEAWLFDITHWRGERRIRIGCDGARYAHPDRAWTQTAFLRPQMSVHDRAFWDVANGLDTVDRDLEDLERRYGGIDSALIWPTYPNMGVDDRKPRDHRAQRQLLPATRRDLVLPAGLVQRPARQAAADGPGIRPVRRDRLSLRGGRAVTRGDCPGQ